MSNTHHEEELFLAAIDIADQEERSKFVTESCEGNAALEKSVRELLEYHDDNPTFLEQQQSATSPEFKPGDIVDAFEIVETLGEGGFGIVYRALQQRPIRREVALKILKVGMDTASVVQRFEQERQTLALLQHPQIAAVIDAGSTEAGRPYFVMELVEGMPVDEYCDSHRLSIPQRLDITLQVCAAVQHAHQKGIIHRDLKPSNILVSSGLIDGKEGTTEPIVKVIDFGIAKVVSSPSSGFTQQGQLLGTPDYMSPEQREQAGDVDIRSDIYSLGALLCKLLTGRPPKFHSTKQNRSLLQDSLILPSSQIRQFDEKRLQTVALNRRETSKSLPKVFRGELDWISRKALAVSRDDRYSSVATFASDLRAFLKNQPVAAGPPTWGYHAKKFLRRNQLASLMLGLVVLSVLVGASLSTIGFLRANREWKRAETERASAIAERDKSQATAELMQRLLNTGNVQAGHRADFTVRQMLDEFSEMLDSKSATNLASQPTVEANVRQTLGKSYWSLGLMDRAGPHLHRALELKRCTSGNDHVETARCEIDYAKYLASTSQLSEAEKTTNHAMPILKSSTPSEELAWAHRVQAITDRERGDFTSSLNNSRIALELAQSTLGQDHPTSVYLKIELAPTLLELREFEEADAISREALHQATRLGEETFNTAAANRNRALVLELYDLPKASELIRTALRIDRKVVGESSGSVVLDLITLARIYRRRGRIARSEEAARRACEYAESITIEPRVIQPQAYDQLAQVVRDDDPREAIELWQKAIDLKRQSQLIHPIVGHYLEGQASSYRQLGESEQAEAKYRECIALLESVSVQDIRRDGRRLKKRPKPASELALYYSLAANFKLATLLNEQGRLEEITELSKTNVERGRNSGFYRCELAADMTEATMHLAANNLDEAEAIIDEVIAADETRTQRWMLAWAQLFKADILVRRGEFDAARNMLVRLTTFSKRRKFSILRRPVERLKADLPAE